MLISDYLIPRETTTASSTLQPEAVIVSLCNSYIPAANQKATLRVDFVIHFL